MKIKKTLSTIMILIFMLCTFSACGTKPENTILGKWYNEKGDCLEILSDNTYSIDKIYTGYEIGIDSGAWEYLEEGFFKFYANNYDESIIKVEIDKDEIGTYIKYTYYGTFYKNQYPTEHIKETTDSSNKSTSTKPENSQVSSITEESKENYAQPSTNQSKPTNTTNQPTHTHSYTNATCTLPKKCSCGATAGTALGHQFSSATCTSPQICSRCGTTNGNALGHSYSAANCNAPKTCTRCGQTEGSALGHNYENNKCSRCGKVDPESLPVGLDKVVVIDSKDCASNSGTLTDSFGNTYNKSIQFNVWDDIYSAGYLDEGYSYSLYNLSHKYKKFNATVAVPKQAASNANFKICIYLDDDNKPIYTKQNFNKTTAPFNINIDVTNASKMRIEVYMEGTGHEVAAIVICQQFDMLALVNAQLTK